MKIDKNCKEFTVSQSQLGRILELSHQRINQLIEEEIVIRDEGSKSGGVLLVQSLKNYYSSKRTIEDEGTVNFWKERAKNERAKRELNELKLRKQRGEVYESSAVESMLVEILTRFRNKLTGLSVKVSVRLEGKSVSEINRIISAEVEEELRELAAELEGIDGEIEVESGGGDTSG